MVDLISRNFCSKWQKLGTFNFAVCNFHIFFCHFQGLKGAVSVRFKIYGVSICFVNSHLCAHDHLLQERIDEYNLTIEKLEFQQQDTPKILYHE